MSLELYYCFVFIVSSFTRTSSDLCHKMPNMVTSIEQDPLGDFLKDHTPGACTVTWLLAQFRLFIVVMVCFSTVQFLKNCLEV